MNVSESSIAHYAQQIRNSSQEVAYNETLKSNTFSDLQIIHLFRPALIFTEDLDDFQLSNFVPNPDPIFYETVKAMANRVGRLYLNKIYLCSGFFFFLSYFVFPKDFVIANKLYKVENWKQCKVTVSQGSSVETTKFLSLDSALPHDLDSNLVYCATATQLKPFTIKLQTNSSNNDAVSPWVYTVGYASISDYTSLSQLVSKYYANSMQAELNKFLSPGIVKSKQNFFTTDCFVRSAGSPVFNSQFQLIGTVLRCNVTASIECHPVSEKLQAFVYKEQQGMEDHEPIPYTAFSQEFETSNETSQQNEQELQNNQEFVEDNFENLFSDYDMMIQAADQNRGAEQIYYDSNELTEAKVKLIHSSAFHQLVRTVGRIAICHKTIAKTTTCHSIIGTAIL